MNHPECDLVRYAVVLIDNRVPECPARGDWEPREDARPSWEADLSAEQFAELCRDLGLRASCSTQGTGGAPGLGMEYYHAVPAYCFCDGDEQYMAWVTPWTKAVKEAALAAVAGEKPQAVASVGFKDPVELVFVPLWGARWQAVETVLARHFDADKEHFQIEPLEYIGIENSPAAGGKPNGQ